MLRNKVFIPFLLGEDYARARAVSDAIVEVNSEDVTGWRDRASLLLRDKDPAGAVKAIDKLLSLAGELVSHDIMAHGLQVYLAAQQISAAAVLAQRSKPYWGQAPRLCQLAMTALYRSKDDAQSRELALQAATQLLEYAISEETSDEQKSKWMLAAAPVLVAAGRAHAVSRAFLAVGAGESSDAKMLFELGRAIFFGVPGDASAVDYLSRCLEIDPEHKQARDLLARIALTQRQAAFAVELLEAVPDVNRSKVLQLQLARAYTANKQPMKAAQTYATLIADDPENLPLSRQYAGSLFQAGETTLALVAYNRGLKRRSAKLSGSLVENIEALYLDPPTDQVPRQRIDWIYNTLEEAKRAPIDRKVWEDQLNIVNRADHLLLDWLECKYEQREEFASFIGDQTQPRKVLDLALAEGRGAFIVSAHVGLMFGGPLSLELAGYETAWLASVPKIGLGAAEMNLISTTSMDDASIGRAVLKALRKGAVVAIAIDGAANRQTTAYPLFDRKIKLSDFAARLSYHRRIPSFFPRLFLVGARLEISLLRMPDPMEGEDIEAFTHRWMESYLFNLKQIFYHDPSMLRGSGGFWTGITV